MPLKAPSRPKLLSAPIAGSAIAQGLSPRVLGDEQWEALLGSFAGREREIARQGDVFWSPPKFAREMRIEAIANALALPGEEGRTAAGRFARTVGSEQWIEWAKEGLLEKNGEVSRESPIPFMVRFAKVLIFKVAEKAPTPLPRELMAWARVGLSRSLALHERQVGEWFGAWVNLCHDMGLSEGLADAADIQRITAKEGFPGSARALLETQLIQEAVEKAARKTAGDAPGTGSRDSETAKKEAPERGKEAGARTRRL